MGYQIVKVSSIRDEPLGFAVWREGTWKFEDTNIWTVAESDALKAHVADLNHRVALQENWPDAHDPEVQELINDPEFEPLEFEPAEAVDEPRLHAMIKAGEIKTAEDHDGYTVVHPNYLHVVPMTETQELKDPSQPVQRFRKASEIVAERRAREKA